MANFLADQLTGEGTAPSSLDPRIPQALNHVSPPTDSLLQEEVLKRAQQLADHRIEQQVDEQLATGQPDMATITDLSAGYGTTPDAPRTLDAAVAALASQEEPDRRAALAESQTRFRVEREYNKTQAMGALRERIEEIELERVERSEGKSPLVSALAYTGRTAVEFLDNYFLPGYYVEAINILKDVDPTIASEGLDYLQPADAIARLPQLINALPPEKSKAARERLMTAAQQRAGRLLGDNKLAEQHFLQEFLHAFEDDDKGDKSILSNIFAPLDLVLGAPLVKSAVKGAVGAVKTVDALASFWNFSKGGIPITLAPYNTGARALAGAATQPGGTQAAQLGASQAQIIGSLFLPKPRMRVQANGTLAPVTAPHALPSGTPFLDEFFLSAEAKAAKAAAIEQGLKSNFSLRLNDSVVEETEQGIRAFMRIGDGKGVGWALPSDAAAWGKANMNIPFTVERDLAGTFQIQAEHFFAYGLDDVGQFVKPATGWGIGKGSRFAEWIARAGTQAELITGQSQKLNREIGEAFTKLKGDDSLRVQQVLLDGETGGKEYTRAELVSLNLTGKQIEGYEAVRTLSRKVLKLKNESGRQQLRAAGFTGEITVDGGTAFVKLVDPATLVGAERLLNKGISAVDLTSGQKISLANTDLSKYNLYRFFEDTKSGYSYGLSPKASSVTIRDLPHQVLKPVSGWMPRYYNAPYFVREVLSTGRTVAVMTARSPKAAEEAVARLAAQNPGKAYRPFTANEIADEAGTLADITALREQGLLVTSHRNPLALMDAEGGVAALSVPNSIEKLVASASLQEGLGKWTLAMKQTFDNTYGSKLGFYMDLARAPQRPLDKSLQPMFDEALKLYNYVRMVNGLHSAGPIGSWVRGERNKVADIFYNFGRSAKTGGRVSRWFADEVSGLDPVVQRAAKSAAFTAYIGLNPVVHSVLQMSMIPTYAGVRHALPYMAKGRFFTDSLILQFANDPFKIKMIADKMGVTSKYADDLLRDYRQSGLQQMVDNHISVVGTLGDARVATSSRTRKAASAVFNGAKAIGFDVGVSADKRAAWLVMRNRALKDGKALDVTGLKAVAQDAEHLTGSLNRSDPLYSSDGVASLFMQFLSHPIKMANRLVGGFTGGRIGGEASLSASEQRRVALAALFSYGTAGYGVSEFVERIDQQKQWNLPAPVKLALQEGLAGFAVNSMIRLADAEGDESKVMFGQKFSPFATAGVLLTNAGELGKLLLSGDFDQVQDFIPNPAALGFAGSMLQVADFWYTVAGATELPVPDQALAISAEFMRKFPLSNNALKAHMAYNLGYKFDSRGNAVVEATKGEAIAALWGLKSYREYATARASAALYGEYEPLSGEALTKRLSDAVQETKGWMVPLLRQLGDGQVNPAEAADLIKNHNITFRTGLEPQEYAIYRDMLARELLNADVVKSDKLNEALGRALASGKVAATSSLRDKLYGLEFPNKERIIPEIERMFNNRNVEAE